jgi:ubiquinone/menaquinone biosynthesis C-methylase UbiE
MLREAHRRSRAEGRLASRVHWICADARDLPFRAGSIDALTGHSVLYLVADREAALAEWLRVLRSGGRLVVMEPNDRSVRLREVWRISRSPRFLLSMALWRQVSGLRDRFGHWSLVATLRRVGFANCHVQETLGGLRLYAHAQKA